MARDLRALAAAARARGRGAAAGFWLQAAVDAAAHGTRERRAARRASAHSGAPGRPADALRSAWRDGVFAVRALARRPGFTAVAALTLALGIGANAAIFSVAWQVLLEPLPFAQESRLVTVWETWRAVDGLNPVSPANFEDWRAATRSFASLAAYNRFSGGMNLTGAGEPIRIEAGWVTGNFFQTLGLAPVAGRAIQPADERAGGVIVLGEPLWRSAFGADPSVVGRTIHLDDEPYEIVGVMPAEATLGSRPADAWLPMPLPGPGHTGRAAHFLGVVGRLAPGVTLAQANADLADVARRADAEQPDANRGLGARAIGLRDSMTARARPTLLVLAGGAGLLLLIAGANLTGLLLARHLGRRRELAVRAALGASRVRLARQLMAEGLVLAALGGAGGLVAGAWALGAIASLAPALVVRHVSAAPDAVVLAAVAALSLASGLAFGALPAWRAARTDTASALGVRGGTGDRSTTRLRTLMVAVEVALAVVLLVGAALLVTSLVNVLDVDPGFDLRQGLVADVSLPMSSYPDADRRARFFDAAIARLEAVPGVARACAISRVPLSGTPGGLTYVPEHETRPVAALPLSATPGCFATLGVPLTRGRRFGPDEPAPAAVVSETMARAMWPGEDPIGKRMHVGLPTGDLLTVVGVARDIHSVTLEGDSPRQVWLPPDLGVFPPSHLVLRALVPPATLAAAVRAAVHEVDSTLPVANVRTVSDVISATLAARRFDLLLLGSFAVTALVLCGVGIYGLLAELVGRRTREIGVRLALGAPPSQVVRLVVGGMARAVVAGAAAGLAAAWAAAGLIRHMLFEVSPTAPGLYLAVACVVAVAAALAAFVPARRALGVDPVIALRAE
jgi:predicted permease